MMSRVQVACFCLIASAFMLAGMLAMQLRQTQAQGSMVIDREDFALLTTQTRPDEEGLFVLDNGTGSLLIYRMDLANDEIVLNRVINLRQRMGLQQQQ
jgi:hypothetical protein